MRRRMEQIRAEVMMYPLTERLSVSVPSLLGERPLFLRMLGLFTSHMNVITYQYFVYNLPQRLTP